MNLNQRIERTQQLIADLEVLVEVTEGEDLEEFQMDLRIAQADLISLQHAEECRTSSCPFQQQQWRQWEAMDSAKRQLARR